MQALAVHDLVKTYRNGNQALKGVTLEVPEGDFVALLGPNGAGKTTLIGIVTSMVNRTSGSVRVFGHDLLREPDVAKALIGVVPQEVNLNQFDTVHNIVTTAAGFYGVGPRAARRRAQECLEQLQLWDRRKDSARNLSGGMKRRLMIARALMHRPRLLILDEPTAGVDIEIRRSMWEFLAALNESGTTIILTTHYLEEAEQLCRHVAIIDHGRIIEHDRMSRVLRRLKEQVLLLNLRDSVAQAPQLTGFPVRVTGEHEIEVVVGEGHDLNDLFAALEQAGLHVLSMRNRSNRLEELFFRLTSRAPGARPTAAEVMP
ncbi:MAG: ABC transporter ATP-binding protein [Chromatiales bacterium]|nr:ABC transporter ATP-binding protein [Chromatiales bacterium]